MKGVVFLRPRYSITSRWANGDVPGGVSPNASIQNDSGLPQGPADGSAGKLKMW